MEEANLQTCGVFVSLHRPKWNVRGIPEGKEHLLESIITVILYHRNNLSMRIGESHQVKTDTHTRTVERINRTLFKLCFHTKEPGE